MFLPKGNANGSYTPAPAGTHIAICVKVIDLGTQRVEWQGDVKLQHKVLLAWELVDEQPRSIEQIVNPLYRTHHGSTSYNEGIFRYPELGTL